MKTTFNYHHYYTYEEMTECLSYLANHYPHLMKLFSICETEEGKQVWAVELTCLESGNFDTKPAYYIDGNHHAGEVTGSMAAMHTIDYLVTNFSEDDEVKQLLTKFTIYVIPKISPDGADLHLTSHQKLRSVNRAYPKAKKEDGLHPSDLDGDGVIRMMRVKTPFGAWKVSKDDPRLLVKRQPDDFEGDFYNVYPEGEIINYDGVNIQLAKPYFGLDFNRNYPFGWFSEARQPGAGKYPLSNPENKAVADFIISHPNIGSAATLHTSGGMIVYPPGVHSEKEAHSFDMMLYKTIGKMGTEETDYPCYNIFDAFLIDTVNYSSGAFDDWAYFTQGILTYTVELWDMKKHAGIPHVWPRKNEKDDAEALSDYVKQLKWIDEHVSVEDGFKPWTKYEHPQLGEVEIGGCNFKFTIQNCPPAFLKQEIENNTRFLLRHAKVLPQLVIDEVSVEPISNNLFEVSALISNKGYLPTYICEQAKTANVAQEVEVSCDGADSYLTSQSLQLIGHLEGFSGIKTNYGYDGIQTQNHQPLTKKVTWLIQAKPGSELRIEARQVKSGSCQQKITL